MCGVPARVGTHAKQKYIHKNAETKAVFCLYRCRLCGKKMARQHYEQQITRMPYEYQVGVTPPRVAYYIMSRGSYL